MGDYAGAPDLIALLNRWHQRSRLNRLVDTQAVDLGAGQKIKVMEVNPVKSEFHQQSTRPLLVF